MEITERFPTDAAARRAVTTNTDAAARAFAALTARLPTNHIVVARWAKPQSSNRRDYPIRSASALGMVINGILEGGCTDLRFFHEPDPGAVKGSGRSFRDLFL